MGILSALQGNGVYLDDRALPGLIGHHEALRPAPEGRQMVAHGVSRGTHVDPWPSPVRGGRGPQTNGLLPASQVSYAPDGACRVCRGDPTAYAVGYHLPPASGLVAPYLHAIRHCGTFLTSDAGMNGAPGLNVVICSEVVAQ